MGALDLDQKKEKKNTLRGFMVGGCITFLLVAASVAICWWEGRELYIDI
jgi:hypothetical protein